MHSEKNILIAGGTGLVGQALVKHLLSKGFSIKILTRNVDKARLIFPDIVAIHKWPTLNEKILFTDTKNCEAIINLAGESIGTKRWTKFYKNKILNSRIDSVNELASLLKQMPQKPKVWVQASAIGFYGINTFHNTNELTPKGEGFLAEVVNAWESALNVAQIKSTRKVILRFGIIMANNGGFLAQMRGAFNWGLGVVPGNGNQHISWIHSNDLVEVIYQAIVNPKMEGVYNAVAPHPVSIWEFSSALKKHTNALVKLRIPGFIFQLFLGKQKTNELLLANQEVYPTRLLDQNFQFSYKTIDDVLNKELSEQI